MRDCLFLVADSNMAHALKGFFGKEGYHLSLGCRPFSVEETDIVVASGQNDPGLYVRASELLKVYRGEYSHAVVMVDADWRGAPEPQDICNALEGHLREAGWPPPLGCAIVIEPEVDNWLWTDTPHTAVALRWPSVTELRQALQEEGMWPEGATKPPRPKEAADWAIRQKGKPRSSAIYQQVASRVSLGRCSDPAVAVLVNALQQWFPAEGTE